VRSRLAERATPQLPLRLQAVCHFWAPWCEPCKDMDVVFAHLSASTPGAAFVRVRRSAQRAATREPYLRRLTACGVAGGGRGAL
jgi:thiol-disulfide isomerase/thioredoxin